MAELPLSQGIDRFKQNEDRFDRFTNGSDTQTVTHSDGSVSPSVRKFLKDKNTEINTAADGILAGANQAKTDAVTAKTAAETARTQSATNASNALTSKNGADTAKSLAQAWAEGTLPGGAGTKSAKEWAEVAGGAKPSATTSQIFAGTDDSAPVSSLGLKAAIRRKPSKLPYMSPTVGIERFARSLCFIGDSITYGLPVGYNNGFPAQIAKRIQNKQNLHLSSQMSFCDWDYVTLSGSTAFDVSGPAGRSLVLAPGAFLTFNTDNANFLAVYYAQKSTTTTISISDNKTSVVETVSTTTGSGKNVLAGNTTLRYCPDVTTVKIQNTGANPIELTGIFVACQTADQGILPQVFSRSGTILADWDMSSVLAQTFYKTNTYPTYVMAVGINNIYSARATTAAVYKTQLLSACNALLAGHSGKSNVVIVFPYKLNIAEVVEPFLNYQVAAYEVANQLGIQIIDLNDIGMLTSGGAMLSDTIHPSQFGYNAIADHIFSELGLANISVPPLVGVLTPGAGATSFTARATLKDKTVSLSGYIQVPNGIALPYVLADISHPSVGAFAPVSGKFMVLGAAINNGTAVCQIEPGTTRLVIPFASSTSLSYIFLEGASYRVDR